MVEVIVEVFNESGRGVEIRNWERIGNGCLEFRKWGFLWGFGFFYGD